MIDTRKRRKREKIDEYDLGQQARRWARRQASAAFTYALVHPKLVIYSTLGVLIVGVGWWAIANYRPAEPPAPKTRPMQMMMKSVEEADQRVRQERGLDREPSGDFRGVFETMRDRPISIPENSQSGDRKPENHLSENEP